MLHVRPIYLGGDKWLVLVGPPAAARAAWTVEGGKATLVEGFPVATRVIGSARRDALTYLLLESVAVLDQPGGLHAVVRAPDGEYMSPDDLEPDLSDVTDVATLEARLLAMPAARTTPTVGIDTDTPVTMAAVGQHLDPGGAEILRTWQLTFARPLGAKVDAASLASSPYGASIVGVARAAAGAGTCGPMFCPARGDMGSPAQGGLTLGPSGKIARLFLEEFPGPVSNPQPKVIGATPPPAGGTATRAAMQERLRDAPFEVVGEAPLQSSGGTAGVVLSSKGDWTVVFADGPYVSTETYAGQFGDKAADVEVRFADLDGDGRTDIVLRSKLPAHGNQGAARSNVRAAMAPRSVNQEPQDYARELAMSAARNIDDAVQIAMKVQNRGVARDEACKLLGKATTVAGFRSIVAPGAALVDFESPGEPSVEPTFVPATKATADDVKELVERCDELWCDPARPVCQSTHQGPGSEHYVFTWVGAAMKLLYATSYKGS